LCILKWLLDVFGEKAQRVNIFVFFYKIWVKGTCNLVYIFCRALGLRKLEEIIREEEREKARDVGSAPLLWCNSVNVVLYIYAQEFEGNCVINNGR
jgi:hypothetical protein